MRWMMDVCGAAGRRRNTRALVAVFGGLCLVQTLSGCILGLEKPDPALIVPPAFRDARGATDQAPVTPDWWRSFRSRELTVLIEEAQISNLDIAVAVARIVQADAQARIAGAALLPEVDLNGNAIRSKSSGNSGGGSGGSRRSTLYNASLTPTYEIDFWGKNRAALRAAEETAVASRFDREVVTLTAVATLTNTYFQLLAARDRLQVARNNLTSANRILDIIKQRLAVGTTSDLEVAQQESLVAQQRAAIPPLQQTLRQSISTLAVLIGRPPELVVIRGGSMYNLAMPRVTPGLPSTSM